jgi:hypothetical protein
MKASENDPQENIDPLKGSTDNSHSALQTRCEADGLSTGALTDVLTMQGFVLGDQ